MNTYKRKLLCSAPALASTISPTTSSPANLYSSLNIAICHRSVLLSLRPLAVVRAFQNLPSLDLPKPRDNIHILRVLMLSVQASRFTSGICLFPSSMYHAHPLLTPAFQHLSSLSMSSSTTLAHLQGPASSTSLHRWHSDYSVPLFCGNRTLQASPSATILYVCMYIYI